MVNLPALLWAAWRCGRISPPPAEVTDMRRVLPLLAVLPLAFAPLPPAKGPVADLARMQGAWVVVSFIGNGERMSATQENVWTVAAGGRVTTTFGGMPSTSFTLELGSGKVP